MFISVLHSVFNLETLTVAVIASIVGIIIGILPGEGPTIALALALPFTYKMDATTSLIALGTLYGSATYGGSISAVLIGVPGTPGSVATCYDGYAMTKQGKSAVALGLATMGSFIGSLVGLTFLALFAPLLAKVTLLFGPQEYVMLALLGLSLIVVSSKGSYKKGFIAGCVGFLLAFIGFDTLTGWARFTFGLEFLEDGIPDVPFFIGMFGISQAMLLASEPAFASATEVKGSVWDGVKLTFKYPVTLIKSAVMGGLLGATPAVGITTANLLAYNETVRSSKHPESFGKGEPQGVIAPQAAACAVEGGSLIPTFALGIPGSAASALFLSALMVQGLKPGLELFSGSAAVVYSVFLGLLLSYVLYLVLGLSAAKLFTKITQMRNEYLVPIIVVLCVTGAFAFQGSFSDVVVALIAGIFGYFMKINKYQQVPLVLGFVLGSMMEQNFHRTLMIGGYSSFVTRPISAVLFIIVLYAVFGSPVKNGLKLISGRGKTAGQS